MKPSDFLRALWGDTPPGRVQLFRPADKKALYPLAYEAADHPAGAVDLYTCVALTWPKRAATQAGRPLAAHAVALAGLWLDIDVPAVPTKDMACTLAHTVLCPTIVVDSGRGIHAWWLLEQPWRFESKDDQADAAALSAGWYALHGRRAIDRGWHLDQGTRDLARLMRMPGTRNGKTDPPLPVTVVGAGGPRYTLDELRDQAGDTAVEPAQLSLTDPAVTITAPGGITQATLDTLLEDPDFRAAWIHEAGRPHWSTSEWDLSIASQLANAGGWTDQQIADIVAAHRRTWDPADPKAERVDYLRRTVARARAERVTPAEQLRALAEGRRAA